MIKPLEYVVDPVAQEKLEMYPDAINTTCCRKDRIHGLQVVMSHCHLKIYHLDFHFAQGSKVPSEIQATSLPPEGNVGHAQTIPIAQEPRSVLKISYFQCSVVFWVGIKLLREVEREPT